MPPRPGLTPAARPGGCGWAPPAPFPMILFLNSKSFLVLFFKKELLASVSSLP
jgi:hypothetical protein